MFRRCPGEKPDSFGAFGQTLQLSGCRVHGVAHQAIAQRSTLAHDAGPGKKQEGHENWEGHGIDTVVT